MTGNCRIVFLCVVGAITTSAIPMTTTTTTTPWTRTSTTTNTITTFTTTTTTTAANFKEEFKNNGGAPQERVNTQKRCGKRSSGEFKIVGGRKAGEGEIPWQAALKYLHTFVCGATLIASRWVLTSAHCFDHLIQWQGFYTGAIATTNLTATTAGESDDVEVEKIIKHPAYNNTTFAHDLALVELKKRISSPHVVPVCLPSKGQKFYGLTCRTSGWGSLQENSNRTSEALRTVSVKVQHRSDCTKSIGERYFRAYHLCAGWKAGQRDTCHGDSGGPLACLTEDKGSHWTLAGVVSSGIGCGRPGKYGLYMNVEYYMDWIEQTLEMDNDDLIIGK